MMANLLPQNQKQELQKCYTIRVFTVFLFIIGVALLLIMILLFSVRILFDRRLVELNHNYNTMLEDNKSATSLGSLITDTQIKLKLLKREEIPLQIIGGIFKPIIAMAPKDIFFTQLSCVNNQVVVNGVARFRKNLQDFIIAIESHKMFLPISYPFANITQKENILFSLTIKLKDYDEQE